MGASDRDKSSRLNKRLHLRLILLPWPQLDTAADIDAIRTDLSNGLPDILGGESTGKEYPGGARRFGRQGPIDRLSCSTVGLIGKGIQHERTDVRAPLKLGQRQERSTVLEPQRFHGGMPQALAVGRGLVAMQLSERKPALIHDPAHDSGIFIHKHPDRRDERRESIDDPLDDRGFDKPRALAIHNKSERISPGLDGHTRIAFVGDPADFDFHVERIAFTNC